MKRQMEPHKVAIGQVEYAIYPFSAFDAAEISGDLANFLSPLVAGIVPVIGVVANSTLGEDASEAKAQRAIAALLEEDVQSYVPVIMTTLKAVDGNSLKVILKKLLVEYKNIACEYRDENGKVVQTVLTEDVANQVFVGGLDEMVMLAIEVVKVNFSGFFRKLLARFGEQTGSEEETDQKNSDSSTRDILTISN